jgi:hypothetical protein
MYFHIKGLGPADKRRAFSTTSSELQAMPKPAAQAGNHPAIARGTHRAL